MTRRATISAVIVNYNHGHYIRNALNAAIEQTVPFDEVIIMDDGSTDDSVAIVTQRIQGVSQARLVQNPSNIGVVASCNRALTEATGDYIFFMSSDDEYSTQIVEWAHQLLRQYPNVAVISGHTCLHHADTGKKQLMSLPYPPKFAGYAGRDLEVMAAKRGLTFLGGAALIRREEIIRMGGFLPELKWHADWFVCLVISHRYGFGVIPEPIVTFRLAGSQYSHARHDWAKQGPVIEALLRCVKNNFPDQHTFFREYAVLPTYDLQTLGLLLSRRELRGYLTPLLLWRLVVYKPLRALGKLCVPGRLYTLLRPYFRV
jgi:hypothetical protein